MASQPLSPCSLPWKRPSLAAPAGNANVGDLLPASMPLCRLRGVCQGWRSMLSDPLFLAAHASCCNSDPLLVVAVRHAGDHERVDVHLVDVSTGAVVRRMDGLRRGIQHLCAGGGLLCFVGARDGAVHVLDPATGATTDHPGHTTEHGRRSCTNQSYSFGQVPATGEYKVLRITDVRGEQSCEVFTIGCRHGHDQRWRPMQSPPLPVESIPRRRAIVHGVAYFLPSHQNGRYGAMCDSIVAFDLETEEWRPTPLRGPLSSLLPGHSGSHVHLSDLSLAELNGDLVTVHRNYRGNSMDMYSLTDTEKGEWSRTHSLRLDSVLHGRERTYSSRTDQAVDYNRESVAQPLTMLDDGRIALWVARPQGAVVRVYDAGTGTSKEVVELGHNRRIVGFYRGSLLAFRGK